MQRRSYRTDTKAGPLKKVFEKAACYQTLPTFALMFKKITATLLLLMFVMQTFSAPFIRLSYYLNTAAYAKDCVNKARKAMHCNGKCQVIKKIQEEEKKQTQDAEHKMDGKTEVLSSRSFFNTVPLLNSITLTAQYFIYADNNLSAMPRALFHPPSA